MPQSLRSILGKPRVTKPKPRPSPSHPTNPSSTPPRQKRRPKTPRDEDTLFPSKFTDLGTTTLLNEQDLLTLRDVPQAMRYIRSHMFSAVPSSGFTSTRTAELLNYRVSIPPLVTTGHVNGVLRSSPGKIEREISELVGRGVLRKVRVERRGGMGEALIEMVDLEGMLERAVGGGQISDGTRGRFLEFLRGDGTAQVVDGDGGGLGDGETDQLVRAGFLTSSTTAAPETTLHVRPEDRTTLTSIQHVSRFASGTVSAVGGQNAIHLAGGGGGGGGGGAPMGRNSARFRIALPGHGRYLKMADGAVDWVRDALGKTKWGEGPESWLRERFEGNGLYGTRWKEFWGVEWEWVLGQAVGLGVVEVFETGSVGKGVRALA